MARVLRQSDDILNAPVDDGAQIRVEWDSSAEAFHFVRLRGLLFCSKEPPWDLKLGDFTRQRFIDLFGYSRLELTGAGPRLQATLTAATKRRRPVPRRRTSRWSGSGVGLHAHVGQRNDGGRKLIRPDPSTKSYRGGEAPQ